MLDNFDIRHVSLDQFNSFYLHLVPCRETVAGGEEREEEEDREEDGDHLRAPPAHHQSAKAPGWLGETPELWTRHATSLCSTEKNRVQTLFLYDL